RPLQRTGLPRAQRQRGEPRRTGRGRTEPRGPDRGVGSGTGPRPPADRTAAAGDQKGGLTPREQWQVIQESRQPGDPLAVLPLEVSCATVGVNRGSFYRQARTPERAAVEQDTTLRDTIERVVLEFAGYGYRRVTAQLRREGW